MDQESVFYYQRELANLHQAREYFVQKFPKLAPFLATKGKDPDVERIIESLAILTAKIHQEMEQNIPCIAESLINIIAPNYTNALPSLCLQEFKLDTKAKKSKIIIPKGSCVKSTPVEQVACEFKTIYDVYLYALEITQACLTSYKQYHSLQLELAINQSGLRVCDLNLDCLHLYLGDDPYASATLLLFIHLYLEEIRILSYDTAEEFKIDTCGIERMGLEPQEGCLHYDDLGFEAFSLLREYFLIPEKFNCIRMRGLDVLKNCQATGFSIQFRFNKVLPKICIIRTDLFSLGITPIINLFSKSAEPIVNDHTKDGYRIFMDRARLDAYEIVQVRQVKAHNNDGARRILLWLFFENVCLRSYARAFGPDFSDPISKILFAILGIKGHKIAKNHHERPQPPSFS